MKKKKLNNREEKEKWIEQKASFNQGEQQKLIEDILTRVMSYNE